ncbi:Ionotropic glutamate receptor [Cinara cedri]|uniref:Ionotropic glutamate receptor n=1 Tax=Cinara cedri TaxID=506608 RepID=A0A5E4MGR1_9HEMI|nr:Ionotropic glutamate receptor [Cinara cedri]
MNGMFKNITILSLISTLQCSSQDDYCDSIQVITNFCIKRHVQTITAATCWPSEVSVQLLKKLSAIDKSLSFCLQFKPQTHVTWYRHGLMESRDPIIRKLYETKITPYYESDLFTDAAKGTERICTEFHGFMVEKTSAYRVVNKKWQEDEKCGLYEIQLFKLPHYFPGTRYDVPISIVVILGMAAVTVIPAADADSFKYDGILRVLTNVFLRRHVQTVTAHTCWPCDIEMKLLENLSANDISVSFGSSHSAVVRRTQATWYRHAYLIDLSCERSTNVFQRISNFRVVFNAQNDWILLDGQPVVANETNMTAASLATEIFQTYLGEAYVLPDSGVFLFQMTGQKDFWHIWNGFRASKSDTMRVYKIGTASPESLEIDDLREERRDFRGITLKVNTVIVEKELFSGFKKKISSELDIFSHIHYEMIETLSQQLNFRISLGINDEYGWSYGNGTFGGLMGVLQKDEIDLSGAGVLIRADRLAVVDYTIGTMSFRNIALFRQPSLSSVYNILLLPFTFELWLTAWLVVFVFVLVLVILTRTIDRIKKDVKNSMSTLEIFTLVHGAVCQQGYSVSRNCESIRVVVFVLFSTSLFVYISYSASISALIQSNSNSISSVRDIVDSSMTFSAQISPYGKYYFEETDNHLIKTLYKRKMLINGNKAFTSASEGMRKIRTEFHGFMTEVISAYKIIANEWREEEKCGLTEIQIFDLPPLSIPLVKNSGHRDLFKQKLIHQMEVGIIKRVINQWIAPKPSCQSLHRYNKHIRVSIKEIHLTIEVFGFGVCISLGIFAIEIVYHYWAVHKNKK